MEGEGDGGKNELLKVFSSVVSAVPGNSPASERALILNCSRRGLGSPAQHSGDTEIGFQAELGRFLLWRCWSSTLAQPRVCTLPSTQPTTHSFIHFIHSNLLGAKHCKKQEFLQGPLGNLGGTLQWHSPGSLKGRAGGLSGSLQPGATALSPGARGGGGGAPVPR